MMKAVKTYKGSFVDYANNTHNIMLAICVEKIDNNDYCYTTCLGEEDKEYYHTMNTCVKMGVAICNPIDNYSDEMGRKIAISKAENSLPIMYAPFDGFLTDKVLDNIAENQMDFVTKNIGKYIKGYKTQMNKYIAKQKKEEAIKSAESNLNDQDKEIIERLKNKDTYNRVMTYLNLI